MLPADARLRRPAEFRRTVGLGRRMGGPRLVVHLRTPTDTPQSPRVGFVVGRAVGNAVTRNTVRRRLRHLLADRLGSLPPGTDLVVRALPATAGMTSADLAHELDRALVRILGPVSTGTRSA